MHLHFKREACKNLLKCLSQISRFLIGQFWSRDRNSATSLVEFAYYRYREKITGKQKEKKKVASSRKCGMPFWSLDHI